MLNKRTGTILAVGLSASMGLALAAICATPVQPTPRPTVTNSVQGTVTPTWWSQHQVIVTTTPLPTGTATPTRWPTATPASFGPLPTFDHDQTWNVPTLTKAELLAGAGSGGSTKVKRTRRRKPKG